MTGLARLGEYMNRRGIGSSHPILWSTSMYRYIMRLFGDAAAQHLKSNRARWETAR